MAAASQRSHRVAASQSTLASSSANYEKCRDNRQEDRQQSSRLAGPRPGSDSGDNVGWRQDYERRSSGVFRFEQLAVGVGADRDPVRRHAAGLGGGTVLGRHREALREPLGVVQAALLTLVGLILAFGLAMAVGRYEARRVAVVDDANAIGTAYLRAQTLHEPVRSLSLPLYPQYTDASIRLGKTKPGSQAQHRAIAAQSVLQRRLWHLAGQALDRQPSDSAPRLYVESLNTMIDQQTTRVAGLGNRVPTAISLVQVIGAAAALALMALYLALMSRGRHRPRGGGTAHLPSLRHLRPRSAGARVHHHSGGPLVSLRISMELPPAADAPHSPPGRPGQAQPTPPSVTVATAG